MYSYSTFLCSQGTRHRQEQPDLFNNKVTSISNLRYWQLTKNVPIVNYEDDFLKDI